jgi:tetratricopeptide (TPR) repeat protein
MVLAWGVVAQGEDITMLALPLWPLLGVLAARAEALRDGERRAGPAWWRRALEAWGALVRRLPAALRGRAALGAVLVAVIGVWFLVVVARPGLAATAAAQGRSQWSNDQFQGAIDDLELARRLDPLNPAYLDGLTRLYVHTGQPEQALARAERLVQVQGESAPKHVRLGVVHWLLGDLPGATEQFENAVRLDPWDAQLSGNYTNLALAYLAAGRRAEALEALQDALFMSPSTIHDSVWVRSGRDWVIDPDFAVGGDAARRELLLRRRLELPVGEPPAPVAGEGEMVRLTEVLDAMRAAARAELDENRGRAEDMLLAVARAARRAGLYGLARDVLLELRALRPGKTDVNYDLGLIYRLRGDFQLAEEAFQAAVDAASRSRAYDVYEPFSYLELGKLYLAQDRSELALEPLRSALRTYRWPYLPDAYRALAIVEAQHGNADEAAILSKRYEYLIHAPLP